MILDPISVYLGESGSVCDVYEVRCDDKARQTDRAGEEGNGGRADRGLHSPAERQRRLRTVRARHRAPKWLFPQAAPGPKRGAVPPTSRPNAGGDHAPPDADLARLVASWANLPPDVRAGIVAALQTATPAR